MEVQKNIRSETNGEKIIVRNKKHFSQAEGSPPTDPHIIQHLGAYGEHGVNGLHSLLDTNLDHHLPETLALLQSLTEHRLPPITTTITVKEMRQSIKKWKESTSTSPSGRHLGIYHALLAPEDNDPITNEPPSNQIFRVMTILINLCSHHGLALPRWLTIHNTMLEKMAGNDILDKLRVIHIFEADFNMILGILWSRRLMANAYENNSLSPYQWGGIRGKQSVDPILMKVLSFEISAFTRTSLVETDKDAASCYDRIVMTLSNHRDQQLGMPVGPCAMLGAVLQFAQYYVKTQLGVSTDKYQSSIKHPLHGPGQGSRCGPPKWSAISTAAMRILQATHRGAEFADPLQNLTSSRPLDGFVDDVSCWSNKFIFQLLLYAKTQYTIQDSLSMLKTLITEATALSQCWERLLWSTGGKLKLEKCFYYVLHWVFLPTGQPRLLTKQELKKLIDPMEITDSSTGDPTRIKHKDCKVPHKTLGAIIAGDRSQQGEIQRLTAKSQTLTAAIHGSTLGAEPALRFQQCIFLQGVGYSLPVTSINRKSLHKVQAQFKNAVLHKIGHPTSFPLPATFGPPHLGALGFVHLYQKQGCDKTILFLRHFRAQGLLTETLTIGHRWLHLISGFRNSPLTNVKTRAPHIPHGWFAGPGGLRDFLSESSCNLWFQPTEQQSTAIHLRRQHDRIIMEDICHSSISDTKVTQLSWGSSFLAGRHPR